MICGLNTFEYRLPKILLISFQKNACFRGNIKGNRKGDLYIRHYRKLPYLFLSNWRCYQLIVINSFIYFFWKKRPCLHKISLTRILYFTSNITYSTIEVEINLSNPFAQQVLKFFRRRRTSLVCIGIFCYLKLSLLLVTLNSKQSVSFNVFHVHYNFAR